MPFLLPRLQDVFFLAVFLTVLVFGQRMLNLDGDLPRHLLTGKMILQTGTVPTTEPFVYPYEGRVYVSHEWLADIVLYLVHAISGEAGIVLLSAVLLASTFAFLYSNLSTRLNLRLPVLFIAAWGAAAASLNWSTRPSLFSMALLAVWLVWVDRAARGDAIPIWRFPALMLVWVNLHGEFIAGILVMAAYFAGCAWDYFFDRGRVNIRVWKNLGAAFLFSLIGTLLNPAGFRPWKVMVGFVGNDYLMSRMAEANPPDFRRPPFLALLGLLAFSVFLLALKKEKLQTGKAFLLAGFTIMALMAGRNVHLYGVVAPFVLAHALPRAGEIRLLQQLEDTIGNVESRLRGVLWPAVITLVCGFLLLFAGYGGLYHFSPQVFPVDAVEWLKHHPQEGRMFNDLDWGGYIAFHLWPEQRTFVDSMADVTGELTRQFEIVVMLEDGWEKVLSGYGVEWAIIPTGSALADALREKGWSVLYEDRTAAVLRR